MIYKNRRAYRNGLYPNESIRIRAIRRARRPPLLTPHSSLLTVCSNGTDKKSPHEKLIPVYWLWRKSEMLCFRVDFLLVRTNVFCFHHEEVEWFSISSHRWTAVTNRDPYGFIILKGTSRSSLHQRFFVGTVRWRFVPSTSALLYMFL